MDQWEYKRRVLPVHDSGDAVDRMMNEMGWDGWELVGLSHFRGRSQVTTEMASGSVFGFKKEAVVKGSEVHDQLDHHGMTKTIGVFKRRLTEERKQEILEEQKKADGQ